MQEAVLYQPVEEILDLPRTSRKTPMVRGQKPPHIRPGKAKGAFAAVEQGIGGGSTGIIFCPFFVGRLGLKPPFYQVIVFVGLFGAP